MSRLKQYFSLKNIGYILFLIVFTLLALEIILRFYNPWASRVKGDKIILPVKQVYNIEGADNPKLDKKILHTKNSLGFRGAEKPGNFDDYLSIITVGGSTTECFLLADDKTWSFDLEQRLKPKFKNIWINNAGLDGHSTFGHQILLDDYLTKIKPKIVLFLVGINDVGREDLKDHDKNNLIATPLTWRDSLARKSELFNLILTYKRAKAAEQKGSVHTNVRFHLSKSLTISDEQIKTELDKQSELVKSYKARLLRLIESSRQAGIEPILLTQPSLVGKGIDPLTGINLETIFLDDELSRKLHGETNGKLYWLTMELYNQQTRDVGAEAGVKVIDLANLMPRNSLYYYDYIHYTNEGAAKISEILDEHLTPHLKENYSSFLPPVK